MKLALFLLTICSLKNAAEEKKTKQIKPSLAKWSKDAFTFFLIMIKCVVVLVRAIIGTSGGSEESFRVVNKKSGWQLA